VNRNYSGIVELVKGVNLREDVTHSLVHVLNTTPSPRLAFDSP